MSFIYYILTFLVIINLIVFVHEYGHFSAARRVGVKVLRFSIGVGPEIFGWTDKEGTRWSFCAILVGGYVMMLGDGDISSTTQDTESLKKLSKEEQKKSACAKSNWEQMWIAFCGPFFNYIYAFIVVVFMSFFYGVPPYEPVVSKLEDGSPARNAGLLSGDRILSINDAKIRSFRDIPINVMKAADNEALKFTYERNGVIDSVEITPEIRETKTFFKTKKRKFVGIARGEPKFYRKGFIDSLVEGVKYCWNFTVEMCGMFNLLFSGKSSMDNFGGVVQMSKVAGDLSKAGSFAQLIMFTVMLSLNLGFINLLPLPVLDGGRIVICFVEEISGKKLNEKFQEYLMIACAALLILIMVATTANDIMNLEIVNEFCSKVLR